MKVVDSAQAKVKNGDGRPSSSGESEPDESSTRRRSTRRAVNTRLADAQSAEAAVRSILIFYIIQAH